MAEPLRPSALALMEVLTANGEADAASSGPQLALALASLEALHARCRHPLGRCGTGLHKQPVPSGAETPLPRRRRRASRRPRPSAAACSNG